MRGLRELSEQMREGSKDPRLGSLNDKVQTVKADTGPGHPPVQDKELLGGDERDTKAVELAVNALKPLVQVLNVAALMITGALSLDEEPTPAAFAQVQATLARLPPGFAEVISEVASALDFDQARAVSAALEVKDGERVAAFLYFAGKLMHETLEDEREESKAADVLLEKSPVDAQPMNVAGLRALSQMA